MSGALATGEPAASARSPWDRLGAPGKLLLLGLATRVVVAAFAWWAGQTLPYAIPGWDRGPGFVRYFARWDSGYYMDIAELGYGFKPEAWAFNPGYPLVLALAHRALPFLDVSSVGVLVSHACFFAALLLFHAYTRDLFGERIAWRAALALALFPGSFYLGAVYADGLFLVVLLGMLLAAHRRRWLLAGLLASYGAITRPPGAFLLLPLVLALLVARRRDGRLPASAWLSVPLALAGPALFALYSWSLTGDALVSVHAREIYWPNVELRSPLATILYFQGPPIELRALMLAGIVALLAATAWMLRDAWRARRVEAYPVYAYSLLNAGIDLLYAEWQPIVRYLLIMLPLFWMIAHARKAYPYVLGASAALLLWVAAVFATWGTLY